MAASSPLLGPHGVAAPNADLRLQILGSLRIWRGEQELDAGPRQQAHLLALLLAQEGRPTSTGKLIDLLWSDAAPASAVNIIYKYIGALRRLLEPGLRARETGSYLVRRGNGYVCLVGSDRLDLLAFRDQVVAARAALGRLRHQVALDHYAEALQLWTGSAGEGLATGASAISVFDSLNNEFLGAGVSAAQVAVALGQPERVLAPLQLAAEMAPWHEGVQAGLITALGAAGQQAQATSQYRHVRSRLARDFGMEPGALLQAAHQRVLRQTRSMAPMAPIAPIAPIAPVVVRAEERAVLRRAVDLAGAGGTGFVLVEGEPGAGKSFLLAEAAAEAEQHGALAVRGTCLEGAGPPALWPWMQVVRTLLAELPPAERDPLLAGGALAALVPAPDGVVAELPAADEKRWFRLFTRVVELVERVAAQRPVILAIDDLHWADGASLRLFTHLAGRLPLNSALFGGVRDRAPAPSRDLIHMLAAASRGPGHRRIRLGPLPVTAVAELVRLETGHVPEHDAARRIHARTAGNAFLVRELSRLCGGAGPVTVALATQAAVPSTVRDVVRDRLAGLDEQAQELALVVALTGRDVHVELLARIVDLEVQDCLDHLEHLDGIGLLAPTPGDPTSVRFAHDLIREAVAAQPPAWRTARVQARITQARTKSLALQ